MPGTVKSYRYYGKRGTLDSLTKFAIALKALSMNEMDGSVSVTAMRGRFVDTATSPSTFVSVNG